MKPKEKAESLIAKFRKSNKNSRKHAVEDAIIHVKEMIGAFNKEHSFEHLSYQLNNVHQTLTTPHGISEYTNAYRKFWLEVKSELQKL